MSKTESVVFADGRILSLRGLIDYVSADLYQSELHHQVARQLAERYLGAGDLRLVLENLIALKSMRARALTALVWHLDQQGSSIVEVRAYDDICAVLDAIRPRVVGVSSLGRTDKPLLSREQAVPVFVKAVLHRIFRLLRRCPTRGNDILRAWVDVTEAMYSDVASTADIRIYPFPYGIARQVKFILRCHRQGWRWSLDGLPYSLLRAMKVCLISAGRDVAAARLEYEAYRDYANEIVTWNPSSIYTSDEYEAGGVVLYTELGKAGIRSVNTAHGVGGYCPHVNYSEFRAFTTEQGNFYRRQRPSLRVALRESYNTKLSLDGEACRAALKPAFVLIHQNFNDFKMPAEEAALLRLGGFVNAAAKLTGTRYFVKLHPNTRPSTVTKIAESLGGEPLLKWKDLIGFRPIFVLVNSTTYFELQHIAPVFVYAAPSFMPELYFGPVPNTVSDQDCIAKLTDALGPDEWKQLLGRQVSAKISRETDEVPT